jgi:hypothetical protein
MLSTTKVVHMFIKFVFVRYNIFTLMFILYILCSHVLKKLVFVRYNIVISSQDSIHNGSLLH